MADERTQLPLFRRGLIAPNKALRAAIERVRPHYPLASQRYLRHAAIKLHMQREFRRPDWCGILLHAPQTPRVWSPAGTPTIREGAKV
jgi:hypothetical protein